MQLPYIFNSHGGSSLAGGVREAHNGQQINSKDDLNGNRTKCNRFDGF